MTATENIELNKEQRDRLIEHTNKINDFLDKKYPIPSVTLLFSILVLILFFIYLYEDYSLSVILKLLTIFPLGAIIVVNLKYFRNRSPAKEYRKLYNKILKDNCYAALRVKSTQCSIYSDELYDYYLFEVERKKKLVLRLQDFRVEQDKFPNDNFLIPPYRLFDIVGNELVNEGNKIEMINRDNKNIPGLLSGFRLFERGRIMITEKI